MARKPRVVIPKNPGELIKLTSAVYTHHQDLGTKSPLVILESPTWEEVGPRALKAQGIQDEIDKMERNLKDLYGQREGYLAEFEDINRRSRDTLLAKHAANPAALGPYGYDVIEATAPKSGGAKPPKP